MRSFIILFLLLSTLLSKGQGLRDSLINRTWLNLFGKELNYTDSSYLHGHGELAAVTFIYEIKDSLINYTYPGKSDWQSTKFEFHKDSLTLFSKHITWASHCWRLRNEGNQAHRTFFSKSHLDKYPEAFHKIQFQLAEGSILEVDSCGNVFYDAKGYGIDQLNYYGHYRGKLKKNQTSYLKETIEREDLKLKYLACQSEASMGSHSSPDKINYTTTYANFPSSRYLDDLNREGINTFDFLLEAIDFKSLEFQNFADGDSVSGVVVYKPFSNSWALIKCRPNYLTSYEEEGDTFHLYSAIVDSIFYGPKTHTSHISYDQFYFYTNTIVNENRSILIEPHEVSPNWFYRGRAFEKPANLIFLKLEWFKPFPEGYKMIARSNPFWIRSMSSVMPIFLVSPYNGLLPNPFPKYYRTRFGLPYPFIRPDFQVAFEEYVLPDWEEYLKKNRIQEEK